MRRDRPALPDEGRRDAVVGLLRRAWWMEVEMTDPRTEHLDAMEGSKLYLTEDGTEISIIGRWDHVEAHCHGGAEHFRDDGGCDHMDELLAAQKPGRDVRVLPFGGHGG